MWSSLLPYRSVTEEPNRYFFFKSGIQELWNELWIDTDVVCLSGACVVVAESSANQLSLQKDLWGSQQEERRLCLPNHLQDISTSLLEGCGGGSTQYNSSTRKATANTEANHWGNEVAVSARPNSASFHCPGLHSSPALSAWIAQLRGMQTMLCCSL